MLCPGGAFLPECLSERFRAAGRMRSRSRQVVEAISEGLGLNDRPGLSALLEHVLGDEVRVVMIENAAVARPI